MNTRELYKEVTSKVLRVYEIFQDYFGEDKVDLQGLRTEDAIVETFGEEETDRAKIYQFLSIGHKYIYVHFPEVRVTNEHDRYVDIKNLWARVEVLLDGRLANRFTLNRSEYSLEHIEADYMHSHISGINYGDPSTFMIPCTGSGPINRTIASLCTDYDEDLWMLFCCELSLFVTVESLAGVPYRHLEQIAAGNTASHRVSRSSINENASPTLKKYSLGLNNYRLFQDFYRYFINKKCLKFSYCNNGYYLGMSFLDFRIMLSNNFIEWINRPDNPYRLSYPYEILISDEILKKYIIKDNKLYLPRARTFGSFGTEESLRANFENRRVLTFKGEEIKTVITGLETPESENFTLLLKKSICTNFLSLILRTINYNYGISSSESSNDSCRETRYI